MARTGIRKKVVMPASVPAINSQFKRYGSEPERIVRKQEKKKDKTVEELKQLFRKTDLGPADSRSWDTAYNRIADSLKNHKYSVTDVEKLSIALVEFREESDFRTHAGLFLSALINNGKDDDFIIHTAHLGVPIGYLGYKNTKNITIDGDVDGWIGYGMQGGIITVKGNADHLIGNVMTDGSITVEGDVGDFSGHLMGGGTITVKGNAGAGVGASMKGGTIFVEGNAGIMVGNAMDAGEIRIEGVIRSFGSFIHGKIYHKGKLIVDK